MFTTNLQENSIEISNTITNTYAKIYLNLGASLQKLMLNGKEIIKDCYPLEYKVSYASAVMFPFASRIENGTYFFKGKRYQLPINEINNNAALHGLVYNKTFKLVEQLTTNKYAKVVVQYASKGTQKGFPFKYCIEICYTVTNNELSIKFSIKNTDSSSFPFGLGWHPYFYSSNLYNSFVSFKSNKQAVFNRNLILENFKDILIEEPFQIKGKKLDDCYLLTDNTLFFTTPNYKIAFTTSKDSYLQLYTPPINKNVIAIEPITASGNSFNNKNGLQILESLSEYNTTWAIKLTN